MAITHNELKTGDRVELFERNMKTPLGNWLPLRIVGKSATRIQVQLENGDKVWLYMEGANLRYRLWATRNGF